jgi:hypothetical protein
MNQVNNISGSQQNLHRTARFISLLRRSVYLGWLIVIGLYVLAFRPLQQRLHHLNDALDAASLDFANSPIGAPESTWSRFEALRGSIQKTQRKSEAWLDRAAFDSGVYDQVNEEKTKAQLLETSRIRRSAQFKTISQAHAMTIASQVFETLSDSPAASGRWAGADRESGLWAHGETLYQALTTSALAGVSSVQVARYLPPRPHFNENSDSFLEDLPVYLHVSGSLDSVFSYLSALPLAEEEILEVGLPDFPGEKRPLFIDSLELTAVQEPLGNVEAHVVIIGLFALNSETEAETETETESPRTARNVRNSDWSFEMMK